MAGIKIGNLQTEGILFLAPMAGITDLPFRKICRKLGAAAAFGEMVASKEELLNTSKSLHRLNFKDEEFPRIVQLLGSNPIELSKAAKRAVELGAQVVDFNCGCPARKVCNGSCGSALLRNPKLIREILEALVSSVDVPITLKFRTGWDSEENNALEIGEIAQKAGVSMLTLHGRTKEQGFKGKAEYETVRRLKKSVDIPVIANGDIDSPEKAIQVLENTGVDGLIIGRASLGNPWIFRSIEAVLHGLQYVPPSFNEMRSLMIEHMKDHFNFYGERNALRSFRKHLNWYLRPLGTTDEDMKNLYEAGDQESMEDKVLDLLSHLEISRNSRSSFSNDKTSPHKLFR